MTRLRMVFALAPLFALAACGDDDGSGLRTLYELRAGATVCGWQTSPSQASRLGALIADAERQEGVTTDAAKAKLKSDAEADLRANKDRCAADGIFHTTLVTLAGS